MGHLLAPDVPTIVPLLLVTFLAALVQGIAGFGFALIAVPLFVWLLASPEAVTVVVVVSLTISAGLAFLARRQVDRRTLTWLCAGAVVGVGPGLIVFESIDVDQLMAGAGALIVALVAVLTLRAPAATGRNRAPVPRRSSVAGIGALSAAMTVALGMPGPPVILYLTGVGFRKEVLRATTLAFFAVAYLAALTLQLVSGSVGRATLVTGVLLVPAACVGGLAGSRLAGGVDERSFRAGVLGLLALIGVSALVRGLMG